MKALRIPQKPAFQWRVKSKSSDECHIVSWSDKDGWSCSCIAGGFGRICRHQRICQNKFKNLTYDEENY